MILFTLVFLKQTGAQIKVFADCLPGSTERIVSIRGGVSFAILLFHVKNSFSLPMQNFLVVYFV